MRRILLWMARNDWMRRHLPNLWFARRAVRRFMPGETPEAALDAAAKFKDLGIGVLFTRLGETLTGVDDGDATATDYLKLMADADARGIPAEVSVKLTQLGFDLDQERALQHMGRLAEAAGERTVWIDMEGSDYTEATIAFYETPEADTSEHGHLPAGLPQADVHGRRATGPDRAADPPGQGRVRRARLDRLPVASRGRRQLPRPVRVDAARDQGRSRAVPGPGHP